MSTTLEIKQEVASQLGKTNGDVADTKRDIAIKRARRQFYGEYPWSRLKKAGTMTFANGVADFPADFDPSFQPKIFAYVGNLKREYVLVGLDEVDSYTTDSPVFSVDITNSQFLTNLDGDVEINYQMAVSDTLSDTFEEPTDDISAIVSLAVAMFWLSSERNDDMFKLFRADYDKQVGDLIRADRLRQPVRRFKVDISDYGYQE